MTIGIDAAFLAKHTQDIGLLESLYQEREREEQRQLVEEARCRWMQLFCRPFIVESLESNPYSAAEFGRRVAQVRARMQEREREERERPGVHKRPGE